MQATKKEIFYFILFWTTVTLWGAGLYGVHGELPEVSVHAATRILTVAFSLGVFLVLWNGRNWVDQLEYYVLGTFFFGVAIFTFFSRSHCTRSPGLRFVGE